MHRIKHWLLISSSIAFVGCRALEEEALSKFFAAVQSDDRATVAGISTVNFSGPAESWRIVEIGPETRAPFYLPELRRRAIEEEEERDRQFLEYSQFRRENIEDLKTIQGRLDEDPTYRFQGKRGEVQAAWQGFRERYEALDRRRQETLREIDAEIKLAKMSLMSSEEIDKFEGEAVFKEVILSVNDGQSGERNYRFVLRKYNLMSQQGDYQPPSRWIITSVEPR